MKVTAPLDGMDEVVNAFITARLHLPDAEVAFTPAVNDAAVSAARRELSELTGRLDELYAEAARPDGPSMALVAAAERELLPRIEAAQSKLRTLQRPPALRGYDRADLAERWPQYPVGERRAVVMALAEVILSPVGKGGRWSHLRLAESRWHGDAKTWGEHWSA